MHHHVSGQFSHGNHVGRLLQFDHLLVDKAASVVQDDIWVERAVLGLALRCGSGISALALPRSSGSFSSRVTAAGESGSFSAQTVRDLDVLDGSTALALQMQFGRA